MMAYVIRYAGNYESTLALQGERCGEYEYETIDAALRALDRVVGTGIDPEATVRADDGWLVYCTQEDADRDADGASAVAVIERCGQ